MSEADRSLWKAVFNDDADGVCAALEAGAGLAFKIGELSLHSAIEATRQMARTHPEQRLGHCSRRARTPTMPPKPG
jgi:hypothetical protein